jgi:hypothetical protein
MKQTVAVKPLTDRLSARGAKQFLQREQVENAMLWVRTSRNGKGRIRKRYVVVSVVARRRSVLPGRREKRVPSFFLVSPDSIG